MISSDLHRGLNHLLDFSYSILLSFFHFFQNSSREMIKKKKYYTRPFPFQSVHFQKFEPTFLTPSDNRWWELFATNLQEWGSAPISLKTLVIEPDWGSLGDPRLHYKELRVLLARPYTAFYPPLRTPVHEARVKGRAGLQVSLRMHRKRPKQRGGGDTLWERRKGGGRGGGLKLTPPWWRTIWEINQGREDERKKKRMRDERK